jgi:hypothetical protein
MGMVDILNVDPLQGGLAQLEQGPPRDLLIALNSIGMYFTLHTLPDLMMFARAASLGPMNPVLSAFLVDAGVSAPTEGGLLGA